MRAEEGGLYDRAVRTRFGTYRGLIRLLLAEAELRLGRLDAFRDVDLARVERLVFVCMGNVCRSPYAELIAREEGMRCASLGLSTASGIPADADGQATARALGRDLGGHRATDIDDFQLRDSDLLLVMEVRQARALAARLGGVRAQVALLGCWSRPRRVHIHDPMTLSLGYFARCYQIIDSAVRRLAEDLREHGAGAHAAATTPADEPVASPERSV